MKKYKAVSLVQRMNPISVTYVLSNAEPILHTPTAAKGISSLSQNITLIYVNSCALSKNGAPVISNKNCYLYIDCVPVASDKWNYDDESGVLMFDNCTHKGYINIMPGTDECHGIISNASGIYSVSVIVKPLKYKLAIAKDGAYTKSAGSQPVLAYDPASDMWKNAWANNKQENALNLIYKLEHTPVVGQEVYDLAMQFESPDEDMWVPSSGSYAALLDGDFNISFDLGVGVQPSVEYNLYPYKLVGKLDPFGQVFTGAMLTGENSAKGTAYGVIGHYVNDSNICGTYRLEEKKELFTVIGGELYIEGIKASGIYVDGEKLSWDFSQDINCKKFLKALPLSGELYFSKDGTSITGCSWFETASIKGKKAAFVPIGIRMSPDEVIASRPTLVGEYRTKTNEEHPSYIDLLAMSQYQTDSSGIIHDVIQEKAMDDFFELMKHYIPTDLYKQFVNINVDDLSPELRGIAEMKGDDGSTAQTVYEPYTTAYLTTLLSTAKDDPYSEKLNATRSKKYISQNLTSNKVYQNQAPAIYKLEWLKKFPKMQQYIDDQENYGEYYKTMIESDAAQWKEDAKQSFDQNDDESKKALEEYRKHIEKIAYEAVKNKKYWAYFLLRYTMTPSFLAAIQIASLGGSVTQTSEITKKVQQISALITVLDPSRNSLLVQEFMQILTMFQLANVVPMLFDLSGDGSLADYSFAATKILKEFADKYMNSADETLRNYAVYIKSLETEDFSRLYRCLSYAYNSLDGLFVYSKFVANFDKWYQKLFGKIPKLMSYIGIMGALSAGMIMFATGKVSWKDLSTLDQIKLIGTGVGLLATIAVKITQRAMLVNMLKADTGVWKRVGCFFWFSTENKVRALSTPAMINARFKSYFIGEMGLGKASLEEIAANARIIGHVEEEVGMFTKIFGKNLDVTLSRGMGTIFAIAGIVFSVISLCNDTEDLQFASDALFLASSCIELIAIGAGVIGFEMLSTVLGVVGVVVVLAGCIVMFIYINKPRPTPLEEFSKKQAKELGLYMEHGYDIDSFQIIPASGSLPSQSGVALYIGVKNKSVLFRNDGTATLGAFNGKAESCLGLDVDADGNVRFFAVLKNRENKNTTYYLTHDAQGKVTTAEYVSANDNRTQLWRCVPNGTNKRDDKGHLKRAEFAIMSSGTNPQYLCINSTGTGLDLSNTQMNWMVEMETAAAADLQMSDITLHLFDRDRTFYPHLGIQGSDPKVFAISPALPAFMMFNTSTGAVSQKIATAPSITPKQTYTISLTDALGNHLGPVAFTFEVKEASVL